MNDQIITVTTCPYSRAQLIKARLEAEGIECFLSHINLIQADVAEGVDVKINEKDADRAWAIIEQMKDVSGVSKLETVKQMRAIRRILVPVDFSETSINACSFALGLGQKLKAEVKLLYSYFNPVISSEPYLEGQTFNFMIDNIIHGVEQEARKQMNALKKKLKRQIEDENLTFVRLTSSLDRGIPESVILKHIDSYKPGIVIMGTRGMGRSAVGYLGSVTKKVIEKADIPVLLIPEKSIFTGMQYITRVMYATNFDDSDFKSLRKLMTLVRPFNMIIHVAHISVDDSDSLDLARMTGIKNLLEEEYAGFRFMCDVISHKEVIQGLQDYIETREIDLIALTTHKRGVIERMFNPSIAKKMIFHSYVPLLVFHS
jgi:nucleotide-binding universal stress UspA family protein